MIDLAPRETQTTNQCMYEVRVVYIQQYHSQCTGSILVRVFRAGLVVLTPSDTYKRTSCCAASSIKRASYVAFPIHDNGAETEDKCNSSAIPFCWHLPRKNQSGSCAAPTQRHNDDGCRPKRSRSRRRSSSTGTIITITVMESNCKGNSNNHPEEERERT